MVLTLMLAFSLIFFFGHGEMLRVKGSPADRSSASRTCPCLLSLPSHPQRDNLTCRLKRNSLEIGATDGSVTALLLYVAHSYGRRPTGTPD